MGRRLDVREQQLQKLKQCKKQIKSEKHMQNLEYTAQTLAHTHSIKHSV